MRHGPGEIQIAKEQMKMKEMKTYTCPMHPDEKSDKPGNCPICGSKLNLSPKEKMKMKEVGMYTCPMHPDVVADKSGKCPKCGMDTEKNRNGIYLS